MILPINCKSPIRQKYLDETQVLASWFIFGEHLNGTVDLSDGNEDILEELDREKAYRIIAARDEFLKVVSKELSLS